MKKGKALQLAIVTGIIGSTSLMQVQGMEAAREVQVLNPVVVTAQRFETKDLDTAASVTVLTEEDMKNSGAKSVFDAVGMATGITNFSYAPMGVEFGSMDSRVTIRGLERSALVLVNGAPINLDGKNSLNGLMMDNVDRVEIVRGAGSAQYGSEALGGVINVITKQPDKANGMVAVRMGNEGYRKYVTTVGTDKVQISTSKEWYGAQERTSPNRTGRNYYNNREKGYAHNIAINVKPHDYITMNFMRQGGESTFGQISVAERNALKNSKQYHYKDVKNNGSLIFDDTTTKAMVFFNNRKLTGENRNLEDLQFVENDSNYTAYKVGTELQHTWKINNKNKGVLGFMGVHESYQGKSIRNSSVTGVRNTTAIYGSYEYDITPSFSTTIGGRYQWIADPVKNQHVFTPQWQMLYKVSPSGSFYTNIGKAFTMPNLHDAFRFISSRVGYAKAGGDNLKPEEGWNYEIGYKQANQRDSWKVSLYHMRFKNFFDWAENPADGNRRTLRINGGKFQNTGVELEYKSYVTKSLMATVGMSYSNPKSQALNSSTWKQTYPKLQFNAGLDYLKDKFQAGIVAGWWTKRLKNRDNTKNPDYININAHVAYSPNESQRIGLYMNNILNRHNVITNGDWEYWDLPRNYYVEYSYRF